MGRPPKTDQPLKAVPDFSSLSDEEVLKLAASRGNKKKKQLAPELEIEEQQDEPLMPEEVPSEPELIQIQLPQGVKAGSGKMDLASLQPVQMAPSPKKGMLFLLAGAK